MRSLPNYRRVERAENESDLGVPVRRSDRRHWVNPMWMISSFVAGVAFAVAHHIYYAKLNNTLVGSAARQQWPLRYAASPLLSLHTKHLDSVPHLPSCLRLALRMRRA